MLTKWTVETSSGIDDAIRARHKDNRVETGPMSAILTGVRELLAGQSTMKLPVLFLKMDENHDGYISETELSTRLEENSAISGLLRNMLTAAGFDKPNENLFQQLDSDKDNRISLPELTNALAGETSRPNHVDAYIKAMPTNSQATCAGAAWKYKCGGASVLVDDPNVKICEKFPVTTQTSRTSPRRAVRRRRRAAPARSASLENTCIQKLEKKCMICHRKRRAT